MLPIIVGGRQSPLSQAQIREVFLELQQWIPHIHFRSLLVETYGDKNYSISLRDLGKSDFFTREVDQLLLKGLCRIAIHSAKDLPEPLAEGVELVALTKGLDPADSLVFRPKEALHTLPTDSLIATSSIRREEAVKKMRADFRFTDIRGTISHRLEKLNSYKVDGVVIAEAALLRLGLTHLNRIKIPGETVPYQGQLAVLARQGDQEMREFFSPLDVRYLPV